MMQIINKIFKKAYCLYKTLLYNLFIYKRLNTAFYGLHLGCGYNHIINFCNIDANIYSECDIISDIGTIKLTDYSVDIIYCSHVLEHIVKPKALDACKEWHRVLKHNGKIYISVPDMEYMFKLYLDNVAGYNGEASKSIVDLVCKIIYGAQANKHDFHCYGYSFATLKALLMDAGFKDVKHFDPVDLPFKCVDDCSSGKINGVCLSLNVVAKK